MRTLCIRFEEQATRELREALGGGTRVVLLRDVLLRCGVKKPKDGANHVCFVGKEVRAHRRAPRMHVRGHAKLPRARPLRGGESGACPICDSSTLV